jgi:putative tricarboxylic transport membrane protein
MNNIKKLFPVLFSAIRLFSATTTSLVAIEKLHFVIGGGAGGVGMELLEVLEKL